MDTSTFRDELQKKLPLLRKGQTHCPVCGRRLTSEIGNIALYDDYNVESGLLTYNFLFCRHRKCRIFYASISGKAKLESIAAPNHFLAIQQQYVTMKQRRSYMDNLFMSPEILGNKPLPTIKEKENVIECKAPTVIKCSVEENPGKLVIYKIKCHCISCEKRYGTNSFESRSMYVDCVWGQDVLINVQYCNACGTYYLSDAELVSYEKKFGRILIEREFIDYDWTEYRGDYMPDSILSRNGYRADQNSMERERQCILKHLLDSGKVEKYWIIEFLNYLINTRGERCYLAKPKWEADRQFVSEYHLLEQKIVYGLTPQKKHKAQIVTDNQETLMDKWNRKLPLKKKY